MTFTDTDMFVFDDTATRSDPRTAADNLQAEETVLQVGMLLPAVQSAPEAEDPAKDANPTTSTDDVFVDGTIITAEDYDIA